MAYRLTEVVTWKGRNSPGNRVLPRHLKLAILSRGTIALPSGNIQWLVNLATTHGATWPTQLTKPYDQIVSTSAATVELFWLQHAEMTATEISACFNAYLELRLKTSLPGYNKVAFGWFPHAQRLVLERALDVDIGRLYTRPNVFPTSTDALRYLLLAYVPIPSVIEAYLRRATAPPATVSSAARLPPLDGVLSGDAEMNLRTAPDLSSEILGQQDGHTAAVLVLDKQASSTENWYKIRLKEPLIARKSGSPVTISTGTECWIDGRGLEHVVAPWAIFRKSLRAWLDAHMSLSLNERVTQLRRLCHSKNLPFDEILGVSSGAAYKEDIPFTPAEWQISRDFDTVAAPDGLEIDILHVIIGMDAMQSRERPSSVLGISAGTSWEATTWGGDVGQALAEDVGTTDKVWEFRRAMAPAAERTEHYMGRYASDADLIPDLDAWGISDLRAQGGYATIDGFLGAYYENVADGASRPLTTARQVAITRFLQRYGFVYDVDVDYAKYPALISQSSGVKLIFSAIERFATLWTYRRNPMQLAHIASQRSLPNSADISRYTAAFVYWIETLAIEYGVTTP